jgi:hypothetical protein
MKKIVLLVFVLAGLSAFAATCIVRNVGETEIDGDLVYGAEMFNDTSVDILQHRFLVGFIDEDGEVINTKNGTQCLRTMQSKTSNYYSADSGVDPDDVGVVLSRMVLDSSLRIGQALDNDITIEDGIDAIRDDDEVTVSGTVTNDGNDDLEDVRVCVVIFNDQDDVVLVALSSEFDLDADDDHDFSVNAVVTDDADDSEYVHVFVDGKNAEEDDQFIEPVSEKDIEVEDCDEAPATATGTPATATPTHTPAAPTNTPTNTPTADPTDCD